MATKTKATGFGTQSYFDKPGSIGTSASYSTNRTVFAQGDSADSVFYIEKGKVQVSVLSERGSEGVLAILGLGDFFGEGSLSGQLRRMASVVTITFGKPIGSALIAAVPIAVPPPPPSEITP